MTYAESRSKLDELFALHGKDYVVHAGNHPEILRAWSDHSVEQMEAERVLRDQDPTSGG